jgi:CheY-like chemotaxis protein
MPTILVADDSLSVRKVAERLLKEAGLDVALAANGEEAMAWMSTQRPDLVIADVIMPDKSGFEVCAYVRAQTNLANTPVLLVSGFVDDEVTRQAEACKADGVIKKPFQGASLCERVMQLLSERKEQAAPPPAAAAEPVIEMPVAAPEPVIEMPVAVPEPAIEMPVAAPEPEVAVQAAPPRPAPAPAVMAAPVAEGAPAAQIEEQLRVLHETIQGLEQRVAEQEKGLAQLEQQLQVFRENATRAVAQTQDLEARLAEEEKQSAELRTRLAELEPAAASAKQLLRMLVEFARTLKPGGS